MQYVTRSEQRQINAVGAYPRRKLNPLEELIKHVVGVSAMPYKSQKERKAKDEEAAQVMRNLEGLVHPDSMTVAQVKAAIFSDTALKQLLELYPYVEFEKVIVGDTSHFNIFQRLRRNDTKFDLVKEAALWIESFKELVADLPTKYGPVFIKTPNTDFHALREWATLKENGFKPALGLNLGKKLEERLCGKSGLFSEHVGALRFVLSSNLHKEPDLHRRVGVEKGPEDFYMERVVEIVKGYRKHFEVEYLVVKTMDGNPLFYFQLS